MITLPRRMPDGRPLREHPFLTARRFISRGALASAMGVKPQSVYKWEVSCVRDRDFLIPAERVVWAALAVDLPPWVFRPDVFEPGWTYPPTVERDAFRTLLLKEPTKRGLARQQ